LLLIGLSALVAGGIFTYTRMVAVIDSFHEEHRAETGLPEIRYLTTSIEQAENNIRLYGITRQRSYYREYRRLSVDIDSSILRLYNHYPEDEWFRAKIDTIRLLFGQKKELWGQMNRIWQQATTADQIADLGEEIRSIEPEEDSTRGFLSRIFSRKKEEPTPIDSMVLARLDEFEQSEKRFESSLSRQEAELTLSSTMLSEAFLSLMEQLNEYQLRREQEKVREADLLAEEAYKLMAALSLIGVVLGVFGLVVLAVYIRKNRSYNKVLIRSREDAEEMARSKELFMANVSHEIRTPLNAVIGYIKQLLSSDTDEKTKEKLKIVDAAGDQLIRLINDVLDFSKLQEGLLSLENGHFSGKRAIGESCDMFSALAGNRGNSIETDLSGIGHDAWYGDAFRFRQILNNLLSNAVKFTENGTIHVKATTRLEGEVLEVIIVVRDTGMGIEEERLESIFDEYTQASHKIATSYGGTGLGLSIVQRLVELFHGSVELKSSPGEGTEVTCRLSLQPGSKEEVLEPSGENLSGHPIQDGIRILVADDEPYNLSLLAMILDKWGVEHSEARNGAEVLKLLDSGEFDLLLLDVRMPVMDGIQVAGHVREHIDRPGKRMPVIGLTADITDHRGEELGSLFDHMLVKPYSEEDLYRLVSGYAVRNESSEIREGQQSLGDLVNLVRASGKDTGFVRSMLDQFCESTSAGFGGIRDAAGAGNYEKIGDLAHKMAPPARHLEIQELYDLLKQIEKASAEPDAETITRLVDAAENVFERAVLNLNEQFEKI